jgi:hypothetical protein
MKRTTFLAFLLAAQAFAYLSPINGGGSSGITSINGDTTAAQLVVGTKNISASTSGGTTTVSSVLPFSYLSFLNNLAQYINFGNVVQIDNTTPFTWIFWFKTETVSGLQTLAKKILNSGGFTGYDIYLNNDQLAIHFLNNTGTNEIRWHTNSGTFLAGVWYQAVVTYTGSSTAAGFGVKVNNVTQTLNIDADTLSATTLNTSPLYFGHAPNQSSDFTGEFNNFAFYSRPLTGTEITATYNFGQPPSLTALSSNSALVDWWQLGVGDNPVASNGFLDSKGTAVGTGVATTVGSIQADWPGSLAGALTAINPGWVGTLNGQSISIGTLNISTVAQNLNYANLVINGETLGTYDGRYNPPLFQQSYDQWEYSGSPTHYIGASSASTLNQCSPFKAAFLNGIYLGYTSGASIPTTNAGEVGTPSGTGIKLTTDSGVTVGKESSTAQHTLNTATAAATNCGATATACVEITINGTTHYIPYY